MKELAEKLKSRGLKIISRAELERTRYRKTFKVSTSGYIAFTLKDQRIMNIQPDNGVELVEGETNGKSGVFILIPEQRPDDETRFDFYRLKSGVLTLNIKRLLEHMGYYPEDGKTAIRIEHVEKNVYTFEIQLKTQKNNGRKKNKSGN